MQVLDMAEGFRRNVQMDIDESLELAAVKAGQPYCREPPFARGLYRTHDVGRVAAHAERNRQIAALGKRDERLGEHGFTAHVVGAGGDRWNAVGAADDT